MALGVFILWLGWCVARGAGRGAAILLPGAPPLVGPAWAAGRPPPWPLLRAHRVLWPRATRAWVGCLGHGGVFASLGSPAVVPQVRLQRWQHAVLLRLHVGGCAGGSQHHPGDRCEQAPAAAASAGSFLASPACRAACVPACLPPLSGGVCSPLPSIYRPTRPALNPFSCALASMRRRPCRCRRPHLPLPGRAQRQPRRHRPPAQRWVLRGGIPPSVRSPMHHAVPVCSTHTQNTRSMNTHTHTHSLINMHSNMKTHCRTHVHVGTHTHGSLAPLTPPCRHPGRRRLHHRRLRAGAVVCRRDHRRHRGSHLHHLHQGPAQVRWGTCGGCEPTARLPCSLL